MHGQGELRICRSEGEKKENNMNRKLNLRNLNIMRDWKVALKEYLETSW